MTTVPHEPPVVVRAPWWIEARNLWASIAITVIWLAVLITAVYGPDVRTAEASGASTVVPSALGVAFFAVFATWAVAKYGYDRKATDN